jgi:hypothetical protein
MPKRRDTNLLAVQIIQQATSEQKESPKNAKAVASGWHAPLHAAHQCVLKEVWDHAHAVALHFMHYNFCPAQTLRVTPAMEAGISNRVWTIEELVGLWSGAWFWTGWPTRHKPLPFR